ncbi:unnamed protein product [Periconia digitata]|uniref:NmrA-like domain-containing protein n=1 Tax=Periconia digitata TaxID=1303443 RepID=A0A9W4U7U6_9PLEO|nr:unnamed protein product [Periconia digitata]
MADNPTVLIFGPTGNVGCTAAITANSRGAKVWLAMRDPSKTIKDLDTDSDYSRVQADLSNPSSLESAVKQSGAKAAFVYVVHDIEDHMKASFTALKDAGITYIVLLSSYGVRGPASDEGNMKSAIPRVHARAELALQETGVPYTAIRPAYFNTNILTDLSGIKSGHASIPFPDAIFDYISPHDIGSVAGSLVVNQPVETSKIVYLCGPELMTQKDAYAVIGKVLNRPIEVTEIDGEDYVKKSPFPEFVARSLLTVWALQLDKEKAYPAKLYNEAAANIKNYSGKEPTRFEDWVKENENIFA